MRARERRMRGDDSAASRRCSTPRPMTRQLKRETDDLARRARPPRRRGHDRRNDPSPASPAPTAACNSATLNLAPVALNWVVRANSSTMRGKSCARGRKHLADDLERGAERRLVGGVGAQPLARKLRLDEIAARRRLGRHARALQAGVVEQPAAQAIEVFAPDLDLGQFGAHVLALEREIVDEDERRRGERPARRRSRAATSACRPSRCEGSRNRPGVSSRSRG